MAELLHSGHVRPAQVIRLTDTPAALGLWRNLCLPSQGSPEDALLLLPPEYELLAPEQSLMLIAKLLWVGRARRNSIAALTFGVQVPEDKVTHRCLSFQALVGFERPMHATLTSLLAAASMANICLMTHRLHSR